MDFTSSALVGHLVVMNLLEKLVEREVLKPDDAKELLDGALLMLETHQQSFPQDDAAFQEARDFLEPYVIFFSQKTG